jgi:hypothetical protein
MSAPEQQQLLQWPATFLLAASTRQQAIWLLSSVSLAHHVMQTVHSFNAHAFCLSLCTCSSLMAVMTPVLTPST